MPGVPGALSLQHLLCSGRILKCHLSSVCAVIPRLAPRANNAAYDPTADRDGSKWLYGVTWCATIIKPCLTIMALFSHRFTVCLHANHRFFNILSISFALGFVCNIKSQRMSSPSINCLYEYHRCESLSGKFVDSCQL